MAITTKSAPAKVGASKPSNSDKKKSAPAEAAPAYNPSTDRLALETIIARRGQVDASHREAFDELITDVDRAALGAQTKAAGVLHDAALWAIQIDQALSDYPALVQEHYSVVRFQYFLDRAAALGDRLSAEAERRGSGAGTRVSAADLEKRARAKRGVLIDKLRGFAGQRRSEKEAITVAAGQTGSPELLGKSIAALVTLGRGWLAQNDPKSKILRASAGLTAAVIDDAMKAAEALTGAATDAQLSGKRVSTDSPEVNVLEGTVLHEMDEAERCFGNIRKQSPLVARLVPGHATRHVLGAKKPSAGADEAEPDGEPAPA